MPRPLRLRRDSQRYSDLSGNRRDELPQKRALRERYDVRPGYHDLARRLLVEFEDGLQPRLLVRLQEALLLGLADEHVQLFL